MQTNKTTENLSEKFQDFGAAPSEDLWNAISGELDERKQRKFAIWWWISGLAAASLAMLFLFDSKKDAANKSPMAIVSSSPKNAAYDPIFNNPVKQSGSMKKKSNAQHHLQLYPTESQQNPPKENTDFHEHPTRNVALSFNTNNLNSDRTPAIFEEAHLIETQDADSVSLADTLIDNSLTIAVMIPPSKSASKWSIGFHLGAAARVPDKGSSVSTGGFPDDGNADFPSSGKLSNTFNPTLISINQFWSAGLTVSRKIANRLRIETGISSDVFLSGKPQQTDTFYHSGKASCFSASIPLSIHYQFINMNKLQLSAQLGTLHYLPFYQKVSYISVAYPDQKITTRSRSFAYVPAAQFAIGFQYPLFRQVCLDIRPEVRYYFNLPHENQTGIPAIQKSWWLGGTAGIVMHL